MRRAITWMNCLLHLLIYNFFQIFIVFLIPFLLLSHMQKCDICRKSFWLNTLKLLFKMLLRRLLGFFISTSIFYVSISGFVINLNQILSMLPDSKYSNIIFVSSLAESDNQFSYFNDFVQSSNLSILTSVLFTR